jgi:undecaprenyl diphosphate synthase
MGPVPAPLTRRRAQQRAATGLRHAMVVGGTLREWADLGDSRWQARVEELARVVGDAGGAWLTLRAYRAGPDPVDLDQWTRTVDVGRDGEVAEVEVLVDPCGDGRQRFAEAMARLRPSGPVDEASVGAALYAPAEAEPDLVLVLGPSTQLPPSLVWELAYAELVFVDIEWHELAAEHLTVALSDFAHRRRRFGGLDQ